MADELARRSDQERAADKLREVLTALAMPVAESRERVPITAPTPEKIVTIKLLAMLSQRLPDFCLRAYLGEVNSDEWATLSDSLILLRGDAASRS